MPAQFDAPPVKHRYGWIPDRPDQRDQTFVAAPGILANTNGDLDLRETLGDAYDQGQIRSCTANAIAAALEYELLKQNLPAFTPSRLFIYYNTRLRDDTLPFDAGASIRNAMQSVASEGFCSEILWPYTPGALVTLPSPECYAMGKTRRSIGYQRLPRSLAQMKGCLAEGYPFLFGFTAYEAFETPVVAKTGVLAMPAHAESALGGHAVLAVGFSEARQAFLVRNSWGPGWGLEGHFYMPAAYLLDEHLSDDFCTIRVVA